MIRRLFLVFPALSASIMARPPANLHQLWDEFTEAAVAWVPLENELLANPGESPIQSQRQWEKVRQAFHELDVAVRNQ